MNRKVNLKSSLLPAFFISFLITAGISYFLNMYYSRFYFLRLSSLCEKISSDYPYLQPDILKIIKEPSESAAASKFLESYGYNFLNTGFSNTAALFITALFFFLGCLCIFIFYKRYSQKRNQRIQSLEEYLKNANTQKAGMVLDVSDDEFSKLQDEIYKTVTELYETKEQAVKSKKNYAENLANIAHQLKTPITSMSLSLQMADKIPDPRQKENIQKQLTRLLYLEESLLRLSRIDAGTLSLKRKAEEVYTLLSLAEDHLYELFSKKSVALTICSVKNMSVFIDLDWTMEAVINLMKNCIEAAPAGSHLYADYENNAFYTQIRIWDEGEGFLKEDLPYLFKRFYRGKNTRSEGIGIGLYLAKSIIEMQNGILKAYNLPDKGACYEIRFYNSSFKI